MPRRLTGLLTAAALAFGGMAPAPALAQQQDDEARRNAAAWMLGLAVAAAAASSLRSDDEDDSDKAEDRDEKKAKPARDDADWRNDSRGWDDHPPGRGLGHEKGRGRGHEIGRGRGHDRDRRDGDWHGDWRDRDDRDRREAAGPDRLPKRCLTRGAGVRVYDRDCIDQSYRFAQGLPDRCVIRFEGYRRERQGYEPGCLSRYGFRAESD